jgi:DNA mismatch repair protein MutS2
VETLRPTYKLIIGAPGRSNAFAISRRLGLSEEVLERAQQHVGTDHSRLEDVIEQLDRERLAMERQRKETEELRAEYERYKTEAEKKLQKQLAESEKTLEIARQKAIAMVESARVSSNYVMEQMEKVRRERESERLGDVLEETRRNVREYLKKADDAVNPVEERTDKEYVLPRPLKKGDRVYLMNIDKEGVLTEDPDKNGNVTVKAGILTTKTKIANLKLIEDEVQVTDAQKKAQKASAFKAMVSREFKPEVDLRGMMGDEAWFVVDKYLDDAQLVGIHSVRLVHGKGTGALRKALWNYLKTDRRVASFRIGQYGEGDGGVTVVELK